MRIASTLKRRIHRPGIKPRARCIGTLTAISHDGLRVQLGEVMGLDLPFRGAIDPKAFESTGLRAGKTFGFERVFHGSVRFR
jgi:hypothetical protein